MNRREANGYSVSSCKKHESIRQERRNERKTEGLRLEVLKKALQTRLHSYPKASKEVLAA
jgi:hypothetical protein